MNKLSLTVVLPLLSLTLITACSKAPEPEPEVIRPVQAVQVGEGATIDRRGFPGRARATQEVNLAFDVAGTLIERPVKIGDEVKTGDLIAKLNPKDFQANLKSAEARLRTAQRNFNRGKELLEEKYISQAEYDRLESSVDVNESQVSLAQKALTDSVIIAPFDGTISNLYVENFEAVMSKKVIARLLDSSKIEMVINLPETLISQLGTIDEIKVSFDPFPEREFIAEILEVSNEASETTRTYPVTLIFPQPEDIVILPGMAGRAWASKMKSIDDDPGLVVPVASVFTPETEAQDYVWLIDSGTQTVKRTAIETGRITSRGVEVLSGLQAGQWVATAGVRSLREGQQVKLVAVEE